MLLFFVAITCLFGAVQSIVIPDQEQFLLLKDENNYRTLESTQKNYSRIAIVGSGITGSSTAFRLAESFRRRRAPPYAQPTITVFERNEVIGGRITQAYAYNDSRYPVDTCASTFSLQDSCISQAASGVGLIVRQRLGSPAEARGIGVWNGKRFVGFVEENLIRKPTLWSFFRKMKYYKRYGNNPWTSTNEASRLRLSYSNLLPASLNGELKQFGQTNLSRSVEGSGLLDYVQNYLCAKDSVMFPAGEEGGRWVDEVQTATQRERFFGSVFDLNVLEFFLGYEDQSEISIDGGNLKLIDRLLRIATDDVRLGREVRNLERQLTGDIQLTHESTGGGDAVVESFDAVIIATSLQRSNLTFKPPLKGVVGLEQKYRDSFVTHFTTPSLLNDSYFNRNGTMPQNVYTTISIEDLLDGKEEPLFFSVQLLTQLRPDRAGVVGDNLFKIVSRKEISDSEIEKMLQEPVQVDSKKITWIDRRPLPQSIPISQTGEQCKVMLDKIEISNNIYYAGAGEQVVGSAEFGCRMGVNAANLILDGEANQR